MYHQRVIKVYCDYRMTLHREVHHALLEIYTYVRTHDFKRQTCLVLQNINITIPITLPYV